jgi:flavin reductase (DIM6/NTAB) family NADH-FMN oxidoreductase RutF
MEKKEHDPNEPNFAQLFPHQVAIVTAVDKNGYADICPVGFYGLINVTPWLFYVCMIFLS